MGTRLASLGMTTHWILRPSSAGFCFRRNVEQVLFPELRAKIGKDLGLFAGLLYMPKSVLPQMSLAHFTARISVTKLPRPEDCFALGGADLV
jgi:hypothetical protein